MSGFTMQTRCVKAYGCTKLCQSLTSALLQVSSITPCCPQDVSCRSELPDGMLLCILFALTSMCSAGVPKSPGQLSSATGVWQAQTLDDMLQSLEQECQRYASHHLTGCCFDIPTVCTDMLRPHGLRARALFAKLTGQMLIIHC